MPGDATLPDPAIPIPVSLDELERRCDAGPPAAAVRLVRLGRDRAAAIDRVAAHRHHAGLAAEARRAAARRRAMLRADAVVMDAWLERLGRTLAHHRGGALRAR